MKQLPQRLWRTAVAGFASAIVAGTLAAPASAGTRTAPLGPTVKLVAAQKSVTIPSFHGQVFLDAGIYVVSLGSALQFDMRRASYSDPITITQVIHLPDGSTRSRPLPGSVLDGFLGLRDFVHFSVVNSAGRVVISSRMLFCPSSFFPQRATPGSAVSDPYPQGCGFDPFPQSLMMGIPRGWGADLFGDVHRLALGTYRVTATITPRYLRLLHISPTDATATVKMTVVKGQGRGGLAGPRPVRPTVHSPAPPRYAPYLTNPPRHPRPPDSGGASLARYRPGGLTLDVPYRAAPQAGSVEGGRAGL